MRVSVVVPVRNEEGYIEECLSSLVNQDYPQDSYEILVVDGRSEDRTRNMVRELMQTHKNIRLIDNPEINVSAGKRIGFKEARGDLRRSSYDFQLLQFLKWITNYGIA